MSQQPIEKVELREYVAVGRGTTKTFQASDGVEMFVDYGRQVVTIGDYEYPFASVVKWKPARSALPVSADAAMRTGLVPSAPTSIADSAFAPKDQSPPLRAEQQKKGQKR